MLVIKRWFQYSPKLLIAVKKDHLQLVHTSDFMDNQVHLAIGAFSQLPNHLVVLIHLQPFQVLSCEQLKLLQNITGSTCHQ